MLQYSRRDLSMLASALLLASKAGAADLKRLPTAVINRDDFPPNRAGGRNYFNGLTHENIPCEIHETVLPPGGAPHPPHTHVHEELAIVFDGELEVFVEGHGTKVLNPGGFVYVNSNELHGWKNPGKTQSRYLVIAIVND